MKPRSRERERDNASRIKSLLKKAKYFYRLAEWELYEELLFAGYKKQSLNINIKTFKDSFGTSGRLDSEYYQEKFEKNEKLVKSFKFAKLDDIVSIKKSIEPGSDAYTDNGVEFIRVSNLDKFSISKSEIYLKATSKLKRLYPKKDTILLSKDGSIGIAYCVKENLNAVTSGAILHLNLKEDESINTQYLTLVLNSLLVKLQAQKDVAGSIIPHWKVSEIENVLIPLLDKKIQDEIGEKISKSFELRTASNELLNLAKTKVEQAIENKKY